MTQHEALARVQASKRALSRAARERAALAIAGTPGGAAEARERRELETIAAGVRVTEMQDADVLAGMGLSRRQKDTAAYARDFWRDALPMVELPGAYGTGAGHGGRRHLTPDEERAASYAWVKWREAMDALYAKAGARVHGAVLDAVRDGNPAHPPHVRDGLDWLADHWRMPKEEQPRKKTVDS